MKILLFSILSFLSVFSFGQNQFPHNQFGNARVDKTFFNGQTIGNMEFVNSAELIMQSDSRIYFPGTNNSIFGNTLYIRAHDYRTDNIWMRDAILEFDLAAISTNDYAGLKFGYQAIKNESFGSIAGVGFYKNDPLEPNRLYVAQGSAPWISVLGINVLPNGFTGIGTLTPTTTLEITSLPESNLNAKDDTIENAVPGYGNSGLRLTHLTSANDPTPNAAPIGVDATGKVVRVEGGSSSDRAWLTTGNNETTAPTSTYGNDVNNNFLGTTDNQPLVIVTDNKERLRISLTGRLTFHNNDISPNAVNNLYVGGGNETSIGVNNYGNTAIGLGSLPSITSTGNRNLALGSSALIRTGDGDSNIGIGYNSGVNITSGSNNIIIGSEVNAPISAIANNQLNIGNWIYGYDGKIAIGNFTNVPQVFSNLENADYQLIVKNGIKTEKVRVELSSANGWPDYVFETDYRLMPLEELETFVSTNKHLPNIPSAEEVKKNGIDLAEMDAKLLEKIEELTLYNIDLYNENKSLKEENEQQQKLLDDLLKRVGQLESGK